MEEYLGFPVVGRRSVGGLESLALVRWGLGGLAWSR